MLKSCTSKTKTTGDCEKKWQPTLVQGTSIWDNCVKHWQTNFYTQHNLDCLRRLHVLTNHCIQYEQVLNLRSVPAVESMALGYKLSPLSVGADDYKFYKYNKSEWQCQLIQCEMGFLNIQKKEFQQK